VHVAGLVEDGGAERVDAVVLTATRTLSPAIGEEKTDTSAERRQQTSE